MNAAVELKSRKWLYCDRSMRWLKANPQAAQPSKKDQKCTGKKANYQKAAKTAEKSENRSVIVFNPLLWKEEIVNLLED